MMRRNGNKGGAGGKVLMGGNCPNWLMAWILLFILMAGTSAMAAEDWLADEVLTQLNEIRRNMAVLNKEVRQLREEVEVLKVKTKDPREDVAKAMLQLGRQKSLGSKNASVVVFEFTDYQCPFCAKHKKETVGKIKESYIDTGKVRYTVGDFPLSFHNEAKTAAVSATCAGEQGAYWKMQDRLFNKQRELKEGIYEAYAKEFGLDVAEFNKCMVNPKHLDQINQEMALGEKAGVKGTPAFLIGRLKDGQVTDIQFLSGAQPFSRFSQVIERLLPPEERQAIKAVSRDGQQGRITGSGLQHRITAGLQGQDYRLQRLQGQVLPFAIPA